MGASNFDAMMAAEAPAFAAEFAETGGSFKAQDLGAFVADDSLTRSPDEVDEVFDSGTDDIDFDLDVVYQRTSKNADPKVTARDGEGDQFKFSESSSVIWYLRKVLEHGRVGGGYHKFLIANTNGPIEGV